MSKYEHFLLDKEGLKQLLIRIRDKFATQQSLSNEISRATSEEQSINANLTNEISRATQSEQSISGSLTNEISRAETVETSLDNKISGEITRSTTVETGLDQRVTELEQTIPTAGKVDNVYLDDISTLEGKNAKIYSKNIKVLTESEELPTEHTEDDKWKLYKTIDNKIYQWTGTEYKELGKDSKEYIQLVEVLPETGEYNVLYNLNNSTTSYQLTQWVGKSEEVPTGYKEIGGSDEELRTAFELHTDTETNPNPHQITSETIGLGSVDNTSDADKPISTATQEALDEKLSGEDVIDNLTSTESQKPLSAKQGGVLDGKVTAVNTIVSSLGNAFHFKGTVRSIEELPTSATQGDCWQIYTLVESNEDDDDNGKMFAWNNTQWIQISAAAMDISSYMASTSEIYNIIDNNPI